MPAYNLIESEDYQKAIYALKTELRLNQLAWGAEIDSILARHCGRAKETSQLLPT